VTADFLDCDANFKLNLLMSKNPDGGRPGEFEGLLLFDSIIYSSKRKATWGNGLEIHYHPLQN
jgi:hypothetical protein